MLTAKWHSLDMHAEINLVKKGIFGIMPGEITPASDIIMVAMGVSWYVFFLSIRDGPAVFRIMKLRLR